MRGNHEKGEIIKKVGRIPVIIEEIQYEGD